MLPKNNISQKPIKNYGAAEEVTVKFEQLNSQEAEPQAQSQIISSNLSKDKIFFQLECKKQIKHYYNCLKKYIQLRTLRRKDSWLNILLRLLGSKKSMQDEYFFQEMARQDKIQSISSINKEAICIINKSLKNNIFLILVLSFRTIKNKQQKIYFDIKILSQQGKIVYQKINIKNWQQVHSEILKTKTYSPNVLLLIEDKDSLISLLQNNSQINNIINVFYEIQTITADSIEKMQQLNGDGSQNSKDMEKIIIHYLYLKSQFLLWMNIDQSINLSIQQLLAFTITFNIASIITTTHSKSLKVQLESYQPIIHQRQLMRYSDMIREYHFPFALQNAHNCWRCKMIRGYICCSECSRKEGKNISLCLNCYESHHLELKKITKESQLTLNIWQMYNQDVQKMILSS